jgi:hypothetical protein
VSHGHAEIHVLTQEPGSKPPEERGWVEAYFFGSSVILFVIGVLFLVIGTLLLPTGNPTGVIAGLAILAASGLSRWMAANVKHWI